MIPFKYIAPVYSDIFKELGIKETDLFNWYSDLYVGCDTIEIALQLKAKIKFAFGFAPQKDSDMGKYTHAIEIPLAAADYDFNTRYTKKHSPNET